MTWNELMLEVISRNPSEEELKWWCEQLSNARENYYMSEQQ